MRIKKLTLRIYSEIEIGAGPISFSCSTFSILSKAAIRYDDGFHCFMRAASTSIQ